MKSILALRNRYSSCSTRSCRLLLDTIGETTLNWCRTPPISPDSGSSRSTSPNLGQFELARIGDQHGDHVMLATGHLHRTNIVVVKEIADHKADRLPFGDRHQELHRAGDIGRLPTRTPPGATPTEREPADTASTTVAPPLIGLSSQFRFVREDFAHDAQRVLLALASRNVLFDPAVKQRQPDFVVVEGGREGQQRTQFRGRFALRARDRPEIL